MKAKLFLAVISLFTCLIISNPAIPCTTFCIHTSDELVFGRNYDFMVGYGIVFVNKKGVVKTALTSQPHPASWVSKYGSVTFNQYGREFPTGGINEAGLVVELMWLDETKYPSPDDRPATGGILQWIQYQLDNCETIQEVIDTDKLIRIPESSVPVHYLVADKYGSTTTIEFLDGKLVYHTGETMQFRVLANDSYEKAVEYVKSNPGANEIENTNYERSSLNRFAKACSLINKYVKEQGNTAVDFGFKILNDVSQGDATKWSIVYDIKNMKIYFKTFDDPKIKNIDVAVMDFSCSSPVKMIDINSDLQRNINSSFTDYNYEANRKLIEDSYNGVEFLQHIPDEERDKAAQYPGKLKCQSKSNNENHKENNSSAPPANVPEAGIFFLIGIIVSSCVFAGCRFKKKKTKNK